MFAVKITECVFFCHLLLIVLSGVRCDSKRTIKPGLGRTTGDLAMAMGNLPSYSGVQQGPVAETMMFK